MRLRDYIPGDVIYATVDYAIKTGPGLRQMKVITNHTPMLVVCYNVIPMFEHDETGSLVNALFVVANSSSGWLYTIDSSDEDYIRLAGAKLRKRI